MNIPGRSAANAYYILSVDVGRKGCDSVVCVLRNPSRRPAIKWLIYTFADEHFCQAIRIKKLLLSIKPAHVIDGNGVGLLYMIKSQEDENGDFPDFG